MLRKILTLNKAYFIKWTPDEVCLFLENKSISPELLIQSNKANTNKLVRDFYLLACRASLNSTEDQNQNAVMLTNYAKAIKKMSRDYEILFRRVRMTEGDAVFENKNEDQEETILNSIDRMQARLFYLTTQFSVHPCTHIAGNIVDLLMKLCQHPHIELLPAQRYIYSQSLNYWRSRLISIAKPALH